VIPADEDTRCDRCRIRHEQGVVRAIPGPPSKRTFGSRLHGVALRKHLRPTQDFHAEEGRVIAVFASRMLAGKPVTIDGDGEQARTCCMSPDVAVANITALLAEPGARTHQHGTLSRS